MFVIMARCLFEASDEFMIWLFEIYQRTLLLLSRTTGNLKTCIFQDVGERWVDKMKSYTEMSKFYFTTDLIRFMINEAEKLMKGSVHEEDFFIFHDALVLMTAKETINWMRQNGYLHRWLLPLNVLQDVTPYAGRTVGNSP